MTESRLRLLLKTALQRVVSIERDTQRGFVVWIRYKGAPIACAGMRRSEERDAETDACSLINGLTLALAEAMSGDERPALDQHLQDDMDRVKTSDLALEVEEVGHCDFCGKREQRVARRERPGTLGASRICLGCTEWAAVALLMPEHAKGAPDQAISDHLDERRVRVLADVLLKLITTEGNADTPIQVERSIVAAAHALWAARIRPALAEANCVVNAPRGEGGVL